MTEEEKNEQDQAEETAPAEEPAADAAAEEQPAAAEAAGEPEAEAADAEPAEAEGGDAEPAEADAEEAEPAEQLSAKERRKRARSRHTGEARPQRTVEERAAERAEAKRRKAAARRAYRAKQRAKGGDRAPAPPLTAEEKTTTGRRRVRQGVVVSAKPDKTITVRIDVTRRHRQYKKIVREFSTLHAHDERNEAGEGDKVRVIESRPLSRTKRWRLVEILEKAR